MDFPDHWCATLNTATFPGGNQRVLGFRWLCFRLKGERADCLAQNRVPRIRPWSAVLVCFEFQLDYQDLAANVVADAA